MLNDPTPMRNKYGHIHECKRMLLKFDLQDIIYIKNKQVLNKQKYINEEGKTIMHISIIHDFHELL